MVFWLEEKGTARVACRNPEHTEICLPFYLTSSCSIASSTGSRNLLDDSIPLEDNKSSLGKSILLCFIQGNSHQFEGVGGEGELYMSCLKRL